MTASSSSWGERVLVWTLVLAAASLGGAYSPAVPVTATFAFLALALVGVPGRWVLVDDLLIAGVIAASVASFQLLPLPPGVLHWIDSQSEQISSAALSPLHWDRSTAWRSLHADPGTGLNEVHYLFGLLAAYLTAMQCARRGRGELVLAALRWLVLTVALTGIVHKALGLEKLLDLFESQQAHPPLLTPFLNGNNLCAFMSIGLVLWVARAGAAHSPLERIVAGGAVLVCAAVIIMSTSRWGIATAFGAAGGYAWATRSSLSTPRAVRFSALTARLAVGFGLAAALYLGSDVILADARARDLSKLHAISQFFSVVKEHFWLGIGSGGLSPTSWRLRLGDGVMAERAESLPVDVALSFGMPAALVVGVFAIRWFRKHLPRFRDAQPELAAAYVALVGLIAHDLLDFSLFLGGTGYAAVALAGVVAGGSSANESSRGAGTPRTVGRRIAGPALLLASACMVPFTAFSTLNWDQMRMRSALRDGSGVPSDIARRLTRHPGDAYIPLVAATLALNSHDTRALRFANRALELAPTWGETHALLANALLATGHRSQALLEMRLCVSVTGRYHEQFAGELLGSNATAAEVISLEGDSPQGRDFLQVAGRRSFDLPLGEALDEHILRENPNDLGALERQVGRAERRGDLARQESLLRNWVRGAPNVAMPYVALVHLLEASQRAGESEPIIRSGLAHAQDPMPLRLLLAESQTRRHDAQGMRATMAALLDAAGADLDARIRLTGEYGRLELALGNYALALAEFERAETIAAPEHPFAADILDVASRFNDRARMRVACDALRERNALSQTAQATCAALQVGVTQLAPPPP